MKNSFQNSKVDSRLRGNDGVSIFKFSMGNGWKDGIKNQKVGGFAFEVQLSTTEKGQYAVAYGLSCKKDCHELHTTD
ncbi:hypothetical protein QP713_10205, partial [Neisseria mucosa]